MSDNLTAALDEIRERDVQLWDRRGSVGFATLAIIEEGKEDVPRLIAALEAVISFHSTTYRYRGKTKCGGCSEVAPCIHLQAIRRALAGEEVPW